MQRKRKGFTLVELLVVIAIIGLLSTIAFISLNRARGKARDAKRISDIRQIQSALELFYNDQGPAGYTGSPSGGVISSTNFLNSTYIASVPVAPTPADSTTCSGKNDYTYRGWTNSDMTVACAATPCGWYRLGFCIGSATGGLTEGCVMAQPSGMTNVACGSLP